MANDKSAIEWTDGFARTPRGFKIYGTLTDTYGNTVTVQESSSVEPRTWVFCKNEKDPDPSPHLDGPQIADLIEALNTALLDQQGGRCAICGVDKPDHGRSRFCIDHDHRTGAVRGLLCSACNQAIGRAKDDPAVLRSAAFYLERHVGHRPRGRGR